MKIMDPSPRSAEEYQEQLTALKSRLRELQSELEQETQTLVELGQQSEAAVLEAAARTRELDELQAAQTGLIEELAQQRKEEAALRFSVSQQVQKLRTLQQRTREEVERRAAEIRAALERNRNRADLCAIHCEESLASFNTLREKAARQTADTAAAHQVLTDEFNQVSGQLREAVKAAAVKNSISVIEREAAQAALRLAERAFNETSAALEDAEKLITERQAALDEILGRRDQQVSVLKEQDRQQQEEASISAQEADRDFRERRQEMLQAQALAQLSLDSLSNAEQQSTRLSAELEQLFAQSESEAGELSLRMETALKAAVRERNNYAEIQSLTADVNEQARVAAEQERQLTDEVAALRLEEQDLRSAAMVSKRLSTDATVARGNAASDMVGALSEMEDALVQSANEAEQLFLEKAAQLQEAEGRLREASVEARKTRKGAAEAQRLLAEAEQNSSQAEQEMLELSTRVEQLGNSQCNQLINSKRTACQELTAEIDQLKKAATATANNLRTAKLAMEKAERRYLEATRRSASLHSDYEKALTDCEGEFDAQIAEARAMLAIAVDKRDRLHMARQEKENAMLAAKAELENRSGVAQAATAAWQELSQKADHRLAELKTKLDASMARDDRECEEAEIRATAAGRDYDLALLDTMKVSDDILRTQEKLALIKQEQQQLAEQQHAEKNGLAQIALSQIKERADACRTLAERLKEMDGPLRLAEQNLEESVQEQTRIKEGSELASQRLGEIRAAIAQLEQEQMELTQAEEQRLAEEAEARRIAEDEAAQRQREAAELAHLEASRKAHQLALAREEAHIHTESIRARAAAAESVRQETARQQAAGLAAGEMFSRDEDLALIDSGELQERVQAMRDIILAQGYVTDISGADASQEAQLKKEAEQLARTAAEQQRLFQSAQTTRSSLARQVEEQSALRKELGQKMAATIAAGDHLQWEETQLSLVDRLLGDMESRSEGEVNDLLRKAGRQINKVSRGQEIRRQEQDQTLQELQEQISATDSSLRQARSGLKEADGLLHEVAQTWILSEQEASRAQARVNALQQLLAAGPGAAPDGHTASSL